MKGLFLTLFIWVALLSSCTNGLVYDQYHHTPLAGWEKNDTLFFDVARLQEAGLYTTDLGLRINGSYPFTGLTLIVTQTILPQRQTRRDTVNCELMTSRGTIKGQGLSYYQYTYHVASLKLQKGDSLHVSVRHDMKREILPGISDVGIQLSSR